MKRLRHGLLPRDRRLLAFLALGALFVSGLRVASLDREPYPALIMPGFRGTGAGSEGEVIVENADIEVVLASGDVTKTTRMEFLAPFPSSHHGTLMRAFRPGEPPDSLNPFPFDAPSWGEGRAIRAVFREHGERYPTKEANAWLEDRAAAVTHGEPRAVIFRWFRERYVPPGQDPVERVETGTYERIFR